MVTATKKGRGESLEEAELGGRFPATRRNLKGDLSGGGGARWQIPPTVGRGRRAAEAGGGAPGEGWGGGWSDVDALGVETRRQGALQHSEVIGQLAGGGWPLQQIRLQGRVYTQENQRETILDLAACTLSNQPQLRRKSC